MLLVLAYWGQYKIGVQEGTGSGAEPRKTDPEIG